MAPTEILYAPAKLTLTLRVLGVRDDGYHLIDAEMVTLDLADRLEIDPDGDGLTVVGGGGDIPTGPSNLVNKALALAGRTAGITLHKHVPSQAGLGGGSSDAGAVLRWAGVTDLEAAARLGADVAFCTVGGRARVSGIGEVVEPMPYEPRVVTLVTPAIPCPTPVVYRTWDEMGGPLDPNGRNDLEPAALAVAPELARARDELGDAAGMTPILAGSGSTWFVEAEVPGPGRVVARTVPVGWNGPAV